MGGKLMGGGNIVTSEGATDGPFVEAKEVIGDDMIVSAQSVEEAVKIDYVRGRLEKIDQLRP